MKKLNFAYPFQPHKSPKEYGLAPPSVQLKGLALDDEEPQHPQEAPKPPPANEPGRREGEVHQLRRPPEEGILVGRPEDLVNDALPQAAFRMAGQEGRQHGSQLWLKGSDPQPAACKKKRREASDEAASGFGPAGKSEADILHEDKASSEPITS